MSDLFEPNFKVKKNAPKAPIALLSLVEKFKNNIDEIKKHQVESSIRVDFINPFLELLGWDVSNKAGLAPSKREVIYEPRQSIRGSSLAPDYSLCIDGQRKIYVEAKRVSENILNNKNHAYQLRRYSWNAGLHIGILTDFEEIAIYDCRFAPGSEDSAEVARIGYLNFEKFVENWPILYSLFSKQAVENGSLEEMLQNKEIVKGSVALDVSFLNFMKSSRKILAQDIAIQNLNFDETLVDFESQVLINKIIFLRICEDRGLEPSNSLFTILEYNSDFLAHLIEYFNRANDRYNSGLFARDSLGSQHLKNKGLELKIQSSVLSKFIRSLYYPNPFEFSVMPADILGQIYELMLAEDVKIIDEKTREIEVKLKPEVKKKGGVFYTPTPIVNYIVEETIGPLILGKTPEKVKEIKIVDPASGSGSFLVVAFQYLIDYFTDYYAQKNKKLNRNSEEVYKLSLDEKKAILEECIFGVDIDAQAVEVSKLSLLLKLVEDEMQYQLNVGHILPNIDKNIRCGNSLIDVDIQQPMIESEFDSDFNPFNWKSSFPKVFEKGGFDAVIGNPPYLNIDSVWGLRDPRLTYLKNHYSSIYTDKTDILFYFIEKSIGICKGEISMIISRSFLEADKAFKLRSFISQNSRVREILDFRAAQVFKGVGINTLILHLTKSKALKKTSIKKWNKSNLPNGYNSKTLKNRKNFEIVEIASEKLDGEIWNFGDSEVQELIKKIDSFGIPLNTLAIVGKGMETGSNESFEIDLETYNKFSNLKEKIVYPRITNSGIRAFNILPPKKFMIYPENFESIDDFPTEFKNVLKKQESNLKERAAFKRGDCDWFKFTFPLHKELFTIPKIVSPYMSKECKFAVDENNFGLFLTDTTIIYLTNQEVPIFALCSILNSQVINFRFNYLTKIKGGGQKEFFAKQIEKLPIPYNNENRKFFVELEKIGRELSLKIGNLSSVQIKNERDEELNDINNLKNNLNHLVENLFQLTSDEVNLVKKSLTQ